MTTPHAFDALALDYDADFTHTPIARFLRQKTHQRLVHCFHEGQKLLEMGCGTGEDALFLAERGIHITATDPSADMRKMTHTKTAHTGRVHTAHLDLNNLAGAPKETFDGAYSNFGVWNCVEDRKKAVAWLAECVKTGGRVALGIMSPLCLWEIGWHILRAKPSIAFRRWRTSTFAPHPDAPPVNVHCPSIRTLTHDFAPHFKRVHVQPLGVLLPPTALYPVLEKRPQWLERFLRWEERASHWQSLALFADHYWIEFERV